MGTLSRQSHCERFIEEFNTDATKKYGINLPWVINQELSIMEGWDQVYLFVYLEHDGKKFELMDPTLFFDPEELDEDTIERTSNMFDINEDEARKRLFKARLITED